MNALCGACATDRQGGDQRKQCTSAEDPQRVRELHRKPVLLGLRSAVRLLGARQPAGSWPPAIRGTVATGARLVVGSAKAFVKESSREKGRAQARSRSRRPCLLP